MKILVLCTGNSARSILLEHLLNARGQGRVTAYSAGSQPAGKVHPQSLRLLEHLGYDTSRARSKSWSEFELETAPVMEAVITVCASAAGETCPIWPGAPVRAHWGVEDPAATAEPDWEAAFTDAYKILERRTEAFLAEPIETMSTAELKASLDHAGQVS
ncbi:MAG: arsenate reductase ArsC [Pseudomonadota bacterium]